ncbi:Hypothetical predicted protein [Pelobates cultripes]|uniref:Uncharacterized protein n=1 Tax=Pelobates cultripes TaxID=61616 RepID=A0AAD1SZQ1_PELCU|nr:Hypothetical predicted protein [Pelobates cultripes]
MYYYTYDPWVGKVLYLEDFYVMEPYRGKMNTNMFSTTLSILLMFLLNLCWKTTHFTQFLSFESRTGNRIRNAEEIMPGSSTAPLHLYAFPRHVAEQGLSRILQKKRCYRSLQRGRLAPVYIYRRQS